MVKLNQKGFAVLEAAIIVVVLLAIGVAGYFVYTSKVANTNTSAPSSSSTGVKCDTDKCFQEKFVACEPAFLQQDSVVAGGSKAYYEIISGDTANCKMLYRDTSDNLDMICTYQDTASYNTGEDHEFVLAAAKNETDLGFGKATNCTGSKVDKVKNE